MAEMETLDPVLRRTAIAVVVGALAVVFDTTIVSIALRTLATELNTTVDVIQWVTTGYLLALGVAIPLVGWAQSRIGGKRLWIAALSLFLVASVLCSLAGDPQSLIASRIVQGLGGGALLPLSSTLVIQAAQGRNLGRVMATLSLPAVLGPILGPVLGGLIMNTLDWRWLFWVNVPFCVVGLILATLLLPKDEPARPVRLDVVGLLLLSPSIVWLLFGLSNGAKDGGFGRADVVLPLIFGAALLTGFVAWAIRRPGTALIDVRLLTHRPLATSSALLFLTGVSLYGAMLLLPLYWQEVRGFDPLGAGLLLISQGVGTFLSRSSAGRLTDRFGARWVSVAGFAIVGVGTLPFAVATASTNEWMLMAALLVRGFGLGAVTIPLMAGGFVGLERAEVPHASVITRIATQVGGSFGVAVLAVILHARVVGGADLATAFDQAFWWAVGFTGLGVALSFLLPSRQGPPPERVSGGRQPGAERSRRRACRPRR
ncbi:MDR family MFS transporter [Cryobacterium sp. RTC2.1]|uniref:MDR family MFS transporter n=2 Tax=unclassified Cryobacterium TaxID=2649013 RepID=UPI002B22C5BB|nr:MDR family MFS transporter [Cryobacterium sp. RTC2.1]MEB0004805.1 MDR family MFS transporter [Cryobacterium sp. RTC2.1]